MMGQLAAIVRQRCPRCREGKIFGGLVRMNPACPTCDADLEREPGYFLGAMYFSYGFGIVLLAAPIGWLIFERTDPSIVIVVALLLLLALAPGLFRYSRVAWLHFDHLFDPLPDRADRRTA
jgi:uncharacterized protein (DUF983 family)